MKNCKWRLKNVTEFMAVEKRDTLIHSSL